MQSHQCHSNYVTFLGIYIDDKLEWGEHIQRISKKISSGSYAINKSKRLLSLENLKLLYYSLVHSHLNYGTILWGAAYRYRLNKLEKIQKRCIRNVCVTNQGGGGGQRSGSHKQ